jgi:spermidine synthase
MSPVPARFEILDYADTPLGPLCLRRRALLTRPDTVVTEITLNHEFLMSSHHTLSERALAEGAIRLHRGRDLRVLIGGLGLGYTANAALASSRVARVEVVEQLQPVISWLERGLFPLAHALAGDPRFAVQEGDIFALLCGRGAGHGEASIATPAAIGSAAYDVIVVDVDHNPEELLHADNAMFYTVDGLERVREHLAPGGVLGTWSSAPSDAFAAALGRVFSETWNETVTWRNELIDEEQTDHLFFARRA